MYCNIQWSRKDRKDDNKFGIDFVECVKIVRFKIGNKMIFGILFMSNFKFKSLNL
jgi:hypothetical protein